MRLSTRPIVSFRQIGVRAERAARDLRRIEVLGRRTAEVHGGRVGEVKLARFRG
jgi:hypothetical protein